MSLGMLFLFATISIVNLALGFFLGNYLHPPTGTASATHDAVASEQAHHDEHAAAPAEAKPAAAKGHH